jgi:hypothetical protein
MTQRGERGRWGEGEMGRGGDGEQRKKLTTDY